MSSIYPTTHPSDAALEILANHAEAIAQDISNKAEWIFKISELSDYPHNEVVSHVDRFYWGVSLTTRESFELLWALNAKQFSQPIDEKYIGKSAVDWLYAHATAVLQTELDQVLDSIFTEVMEEAQPYEEPEWGSVQISSIQEMIEDAIQAMSEKISGKINASE